MTIVIPRTGYIKSFLAALAVACAFVATAPPAAAAASCRLP